MRASVGSGDVEARGLSPLARAGHLAPTFAAVALIGVLAVRLAGALGDAPSWPVAALAAAIGGWVGLVAADLMGGVAHWLCDTFGSERTPVVGPLVIAPFREHHVDPQILARKDFVSASSSNAWLANGLLAPWLAFVPDPDDALGYVLESFMLSLAGFVFLTNAFHQWAHQLDPPRIARWLWRLRVAIPPEQHARHHQSGDRAYCVTSGWCNASLERWRVFESLERRLSRLR